jgi:hypothetical protein
MGRKYTVKSMLFSKNKTKTRRFADFLLVPRGRFVEPAKSRPRAIISDLNKPLSVLLK